MTNQSRITQQHELIRAPSDYGAFWAQYAQANLKHHTTFKITTAQLPCIWKNASWQKVIDVFGLKLTKRNQQEIWIQSPFTNEKTASLHLNNLHNIFKDFSSGKGGGILNFCQELLAQHGQKMNCYEVAAWMIEQGISHQNQTNINPIKTTPITIPPISSSAGVTQNKAIHIDLRPYLVMEHPELIKRIGSLQTCQYLGCGWLPPGKMQSPLNERFVFQVRGIDQNHHPLRPIILTHYGRALTPKQQLHHGKYWCYPFHKSLELYNQDHLILDPKAQQQIAEFGLILVEGFFDVAALISAGMLNVAALLGSQLYDQQILKLKWIDSLVKIPNITMFLDRDDAGIVGANQASALLQHHGFQTYCFDWSCIDQSVKDPADFALQALQYLRRLNKI